MSLAATPLKPNIAVVEDDADLCANTVEFLEALGYPVWGVGSGEELYRHMQAERVDVVVLDIELPDDDGFNIASRLRALDHVAIVMVTGRGCLDDRLHGLSSGADTYLVKPVDFRELAANIDAVARRLSHSGMNEAKALWRLDQGKWLWIAPNGATLELTAKEYLFVHSLTEAGGQIVTKAALSVRLDGHGAHSFNRLDVLLSRLRKKGEQALGCNLPIKAVTAIGYALTARCVLI